MRSLRSPCPDGQTGYDHHATFLGLFVDAEDVLADLRSHREAIVVLDRRTRVEFEVEHLPHAQHFPLGEMRRQAIPDDARVVIVVGRSAMDGRCFEVASQLCAWGVPTKILLGGMEEWRARRYPIQSTVRGAGLSETQETPRTRSSSP